MQAISGRTGREAPSCEGRCRHQVRFAVTWSAQMQWRYSNVVDARRLQQDEGRTC